MRPWGSHHHIGTISTTKETKQKMFLGESLSKVCLDYFIHTSNQKRWLNFLDESVKINYQNACLDFYTYLSGGNP